MIVETALTIPLAYDALKTLIAFAGFGVTFYKIIQWIKDIRDKDLHELKTGMDGIKLAMDQQTDTLANELREQRQDFRTFYAPLLQAVAAPLPARARAKRTPRPKARKKK